jgi:hypothetical protein
VVTGPNAVGLEPPGQPASVHGLAAEVAPRRLFDGAKCVHEFGGAHLRLLAEHGSEVTEKANPE